MTSISKLARPPLPEYCKMKEIAGTTTNFRISSTFLNFFDHVTILGGTSKLGFPIM